MIIAQLAVSTHPAAHGLILLIIDRFERMAEKLGACGIIRIGSSSQTCFFRRQCAFSTRFNRPTNTGIKATNAGPDDGDQAPVNPPPPPQDRPRRRKGSKKGSAEADSFSLENLNPISMGRKSRQIFDDVWTQLQKIGGPSRSTYLDDNLGVYDTMMSNVDSSRASNTKVLVTGATGRVGRVLVRKLLLRGYKVRALVRKRSVDQSSQLNAPEKDGIPQSVEVVYGDVGDYQSCRKAVEGVDKVIYCSTARSTLTADLTRVDDEGVSILARALQDARNAEARKSGSLAPTSKVDVADFKNEAYHPFWDIEHIGPRQEDLEKKGYFAQNRRRAADRAKARDCAEAYIDESDSLVFEGSVYSRDGYAQVGATVNALPHGKDLKNTEGLLMRVLGDGQQYSVVVETKDGDSYTAKVTTRQGFSTVRLPWSNFLINTFVNAETLNTEVQPEEIDHIAIRFEPRVRLLEQVTQPGDSMYDNSANRFNLKVDWIKAIPGGIETDFILVSCAGVVRPGQSEMERDRITAAKRRGEAALRNCGLGYTVVRPGPLAEEAGGYKALVFDQGNRITEKVACADVADVCVKSLHDQTARNKTFELCWEYTPEEGLESWDLLCHFPDKSAGYLTQALAPLQKNT